MQSQMKMSSAQAVIQNIKFKHICLFLNYRQFLRETNQFKHWQHRLRINLSTETLTSYIVL